MLKVIAEQFGARVDYRLIDLIENNVDEEPESGDEIALDIIERAGLRMSDEFI